MSASLRNPHSGMRLQFPSGGLGRSTYDAILGSSCPFPSTRCANLLLLLFATNCQQHAARDNTLLLAITKQGNMSATVVMLPRDLQFPMP